MLTAIRSGLAGRDDVELHFERFAAPPVVDGREFSVSRRLHRPGRRRRRRRDAADGTEALERRTRRTRASRGSAARAGRGCSAAQSTTATRCSPIPKRDGGMMLICISRAADGDAICSSICSRVCTIRPCRWPMVRPSPDYTIVRLLGSGRHGRGLPCRAPAPAPPRRAQGACGHDVCADDEYRERFNREADIAATLWHPHIVGVHDRGEFDGQIWISMDYVDGTDAAESAARPVSQRHAQGGRRSTSSPPSPRLWTTRISAACCTAMSSPPTSC